MCIREYLESRNVSYQSVLHHPARCASKRAQSLHVPGRGVAKTVLVRAGGSFVLAVLPATSRIDLVRLSQTLDGVPVSLATEDDLESIFGDCERGALPPFGRLYGVRTVVDASLASGDEIVCMGNTRHECFRLRYRDFEVIEAPTRLRFATAVDPRRPRTTHRRAS
ncbi:MAG: YbaK/EbsC family protein [Planctomycetia bacterium]|nr:YbaK/EbsC family protein [Planctomycetia bacterium]